MLETTTRRNGPYVMTHRTLFFGGKYLGEYRIYDTRDTEIVWSMAYEDDEGRYDAWRMGVSKLLNARSE